MNLLTFIFTMFTSYCVAQNGYSKGDLVPDLAVKNILNEATNIKSLKDLKSKVIIIDFFGTWCAPCIRALPELEKYQITFKDDVKVVLVSTEDENKLRRFITNRKSFLLPMIVDEDKLFYNGFNPPSYPYTVVLDKNLVILDILNAADLSETKIKSYITSDYGITETKPASITKADVNPVPIKKMTNESKNELVKLSQDFMYAAKTGDSVDKFIDEFVVLDYQTLLKKISNDNEKKAFWINLYNAYTNAALHKDPEQYKKRGKFFKNENIIIAGKKFSLDRIEHDILRRGKIKWSLGYLSKLFSGKTDKELRVNDLDYRIHFALNCGAKSCPPIAFYNPENIDQQLDLAMRAYLTNEAEYKALDNMLYLPGILSWFRRDFGGKKNMVSILKKMDLLPADAQPKIKFKKYDWTLYLDNYKQ